MVKILVYMEVLPGGEYDVANIVTQTDLKAAVSQYYGGYCPNIGNKLWFAGIISEISTHENFVEYWDRKMSAEEINEKFDLVVAPMANIFAVAYMDLMQKLAETFQKITIPIYVIACGVQKDNKCSIEDFSKIIHKPAYALIKSVYDSGGEFALRGFSTKEFFCSMGFPSAVVTGCPSMYQFGRELSIKKSVTNDSDFKIAFNGDIDTLSLWLQRYPNSTFVDQDQLYNLLYDERTANKSYIQLVRQWGFLPVKLASHGRVKLFPDLRMWRYWFKQQHINFVCGSRIHGAIMPILCNIPAVVCCKDTRVKEMTEFFHIPTVTYEELSNAKNMMEIYERADYSKLLSEFPKKYDAFESFLQDKGIVTRINVNNRLWDGRIECDDMPNDKLWMERRFQFDRIDWLLKSESDILALLRKIRGSI